MSPENDNTVSNTDTDPETLKFPTKIVGNTKPQPDPVNGDDESAKLAQRSTGNTHAP